MKINFPLVWLCLALSIPFCLKIDKLNLEIQGKHAWRQSMTSLNIRNFTRHDINILNPRGAKYNGDSCNIRRMEFPIMQWSIGMIQRLYGEHILMVRMSVYFISLMTLFGIYKLCLLLIKDKLIASLSVWVFSFFPVFFYQSINPIPDNLALCFSVFFLLFFFKHEKEGRRYQLFLSSFFLSAAALTKLPFILYGIIPFIKFAHGCFYQKSNFKNYDCLLALSFILGAIPVYLWYRWVIPSWEGNHVTLGIFDNAIDFATYIEFAKAQLTVNIPQVVINLPSVLLVFVGLFFVITKSKYLSRHVLYFLSAFLIFTLYILYVLKQIREGHDYYFFPFLPIFSILISFTLQQLLTQNTVSKAIAFIVLMLMPLCCWNTVKDYWNIENAFANNDFFIYRDNLRSIVPSDKKCIIINDKSFSIVPYAIDKEGYIFSNDYLPIRWIKDMTKRKVAFYLYSDSRKVESQKGFLDCIEKKLGAFGSVNVYQLKVE